MWRVLRVYSLLFESILCLMGLLLAAFTASNRDLQMQVGWLPWQGAHAPPWIAAVALLGLICVALAAFTRVRIALFLFSAVVVYILFKGLFVNTQYAFSGPSDARNAAILVLGALLAFAGAYPAGKRERSRRR